VITLQIVKLTAYSCKLLIHHAFLLLDRFLTDLTFIQAGNPTKLSTGHINFRKCRLVAKSIQDIRRFQDAPYNLSSVTIIQTYLQSIVKEAESITDDQLYEMSMTAEPRLPVQQ